MARSPPGSYEQTYPLTNQKDFPQTDKPPFLPPHLLNIILNKDTAAHVNSFPFFVTTNKLFFSLV
jgi:hypothetical protein